MQNSITIERSEQAPLIIERGKIYRIFFDNEHSFNQRVIGISHARREVRITDDNAVHKEGQWVELGRVYERTYQVNTSDKPTVKGKALSKIVQSVNDKNEPPGGWNNADKITNL